MSMWKIGSVGVVAVAVVVAALAHENHGSSGGDTFDPNAPRQPSPVTAAAIALKTIEVDFGDIEETVRLSGVVRASPDRRYAVSAPVEGLLASLGGSDTGAPWLQTGDRVKRGDVVAVLHSPRLAQLVHEQLKSEVEYEHARSEVATSTASIQTLARQVESAERQAVLAEQEVARLKAGTDAVGANTLAQREAAAIQARAQVEALAAARDQQARELESMRRRAEASGRAAAALRNVIAMVINGPSGDGDAAWPGDNGDPVGIIRLRSPIDGMVVRRAPAGDDPAFRIPAVGQTVGEGDLLLEVIDYSQVQIDGELPESLAISLASSLSGRDSAAATHEVRIRTALGGDVIASGRIRSLSPVVDPVKRTSHLVIDAANDAALLRDGMYVDLSVVLRKEKSAIVVPLSAIVSDGPLRYVFVKEKDAYLKHDVRLGARDDRVVEVLDGLVPGDEVVVSGAYALSQLRPVGAPAPMDDHGHDH